MSKETKKQKIVNDSYEPEIVLNFSQTHVMDGSSLIQDNSYVCYTGALRPDVYYMVNQNLYFKEQGAGNQFTDSEIMDLGFPAPSDIALARQGLMEAAVSKGKVPNWAEICVATLPKNIGPAVEVKALLDARKESSAQKLVRSLI